MTLKDLQERLSRNAVKLRERADLVDAFAKTAGQFRTINEVPYLIRKHAVAVRVSFHIQGSLEK